MIMALTLAIAGSAWSGRQGRKLPVDAYIKSAKIDILSGDLDRYPEALALLDSLHMHYGPHAEALKLTAQIYVDMIDKTSDPDKMAPYVDSMVKYFDETKACCANKDIKEKYRDNCDEYTQLADSTLVKYWGQFYNAGVEQLNRVKEATDKLEEETDSIAIEYLKEKRTANVDSCLANMNLAIAVEPSDYRTYVTISSIYEETEQYDKAVEWLKKGLDLTDKRASLLLPVAYNYIKLRDFCSSIPYFKEYIDSVPNDVGNMTNLAACYNNCKMYDSAVMVYNQILEKEPTNLDALISIGFYYNQRASDASQAESKARAADDAAGIADAKAAKSAAFDTALSYFTRAVEADSDNTDAIEQYALINAIQGNYETAAEGFTKLVSLKPGQIDSWISLGDCHLKLKQFSEAAAAYEKAIEIDPGRIPILETLHEIYKETGEPDKVKAVEAKLKAAKG
jgi:tetratricopeptide (TPR) repeat protein